MKTKIFIAGIAIALTPLSSIAFDTPFNVFYQDFETLSDGTHREKIVDTNHGVTSYPNAQARDVSCAVPTQCPYSSNSYSTNGGLFTDNDGNDNWGVHHQDTNPWAGGSNGGSVNSAMSGNVLGHVFHNYNDDESLYYQIEGIELSSDWADISLMFDFDSWIAADTDGFGVSYRINDGITMSDWDLLDPLAGSDMKWRNLQNDGFEPGDNAYQDMLNALTGYDNSGEAGADNCGTSGQLTSNNNCGFDGHGNSPMHGTAMFDLVGLKGQTIDIRFSFASNNSGGNSLYTCDDTGERTSCYNAEGINIDNIKISAICENHQDGPNCGGGPGTGIPEPASIALMMLGGTALYRRKLRVKKAS